MTYSAMPTLVGNVYTAFTTATSLASVRIFDGPEVDESWPGDWIGVGHDGTSDGDVAAADAQQEYAPLGAKRKYEDGNLTCVISCWDGTTDLASRRVRAFQLLQAVEEIVRTDPTFSGAVLYANGPENFEMTYWQTSQGAAVRIVFALTYRALI